MTLSRFLYCVRCLLAAAFVGIGSRVAAQDSGPPTLVSTMPSNGTGGVDPSAQVKFLFSRPMKSQQNILWIVPLQPLQQDRVLYSWSADGRTLSVSYLGGWPANRTVMWVLVPSFQGDPPSFPPVSGFEDQAGNSLGVNVTGSFSTAGSSGGGTGPGTATNSCGQVVSLKNSLEVSLTATYQQIGPATLIPKASDEEDPPFRFTASLTMEGSASALGGVVQTPGGEEIPLEGVPLTGTLDASVGSSSLADLQRRFPPGRYTFELFGAQGLPDTVQVPLEAPGFQVVQVRNYEAAQDVDASRDFGITWAPLGGSANDPVTVMIVGMPGGLILRSPDPGCPGALDGTTTTFTIPAGTLRDDSIHRVMVVSTRSKRGGEVSPTTDSVSGYISVTEFSLRTRRASPPPGAPFYLTGSIVPGRLLSLRLGPVMTGRTYRVETSPSPQGPWTRVADVKAAQSDVTLQVPTDETGAVFFRALEQ